MARRPIVRGAAARRRGETVYLGSPGTGDVRKAVETAISDGQLPGIEITPVSRVAVATTTASRSSIRRPRQVTSTVPLVGGAHGLAVVTGIDDDQLYVTSGTAATPTYDVVAIGGDSAKDGPTKVGRGTNPLPGLGIPGRLRPGEPDGPHPRPRAGCATATTARPAGPWTVYVVEPHGNAVFADARLADGFVPAAWARGHQRDYPSADRQDLLVFDGAGSIGLDRARVARLRLATPRRHRRHADRWSVSTCSRGSCSTAGSSPGSSASSCSSTGCSSSSRGSA